MGRTHSPNTPGRQKVRELRRQLSEFLASEVGSDRLANASKFLGGAIGTISRMRAEPEITSLDKLIEMCHHAGYEVTINLKER